jgi:hypothetical protein
MVGVDYKAPAIPACLDMDEEPVVASCDFRARVAESQRHREGVAGPHLARGQLDACQFGLEAGVDALSGDRQAKAGRNGKTSQEKCGS